MTEFALSVLVYQLTHKSCSGTVYDYIYDFEGKEYVPYESRTPPFVFDKDMKFSDILVPTKDTYRYSYLLGTLIKVHRGVLFVGDTGTGKSVIMADALNS